ncbi:MULTISPECIES: peptide deformylase [unclassified Pseudodesulfovibrio]|uniref:peptide deformylase n=1 Tax=unclassified Pseudodesulfovibrio TaxID=2661612 RepID=UPI000FEB6681|nr:MULTISPECIES: peptide deformylase [unclassified Pseudodesulfovibrio]MCJ2165575.1 peptide deformylase [Pseudodesulfovibrio sp. S3-i]RWU03065.1 peptide deformylase [Pseudodesulfovibrio sp. S3]
MKLEICTWPDEVLAAKAETITEVTPELKELIENMIETMYESDGVGLAAPQVGESIRLICVDQTGPKIRGDLRVFINPEIVECDGEVESEEGCLSCPELNVKVQRKERVKVKALDRDGKDVCVDTDGFLAIILQHEIDHLNGITLADRTGRLKKAIYRKKALRWK